LLCVRNKEEYTIKDDLVHPEQLVINFNGNGSAFNNKNISVIRLKLNLRKSRDRIKKIS